MDRSRSPRSENPRNTWDSSTPTISPDRATREKEQHLLVDSENAEGNHEISDKVRRLVEESERERQYAAKVNKRWYPLILFMIAINVCLWLATLYAVYDAADWSTDRSRYLAYTWILFFLPLLAISFFIFSPWPKSMRAGRDRYSAGRVSPQWKNFVNVVSAIACFVIVVVYLYTSAIPDYNDINWEMTVNFTNTLPIPSFAFIIQHTGAGFQNSFNYTSSGDIPDFSATLYRGANLVNYPRSSLTEIPLSDFFTVDGESFWLNRTAFVANSSAIPSTNNTGAPTGTNLVVTLNGTFDSSINVSLSNGRPYLEMALFDPRISITDMASCGLVPWTPITPFSYSYMSMSTMHIFDRLRTIRAPAALPDKCTTMYRDLMSQKDPRFNFYEERLTGGLPSVRDYTTDCNVAANPNASCSTTVSFEYGNQFVLSRMTQRGTSILNIWTTAGALVGAVQFFAWFWLQAVGG